MFSYKSRKSTTTSNTYYNNPTPAPTQNQLINFRFATLPTQIQEKPLIQLQPKPADKTVLPKMKWGKHIWTFFHTMAQKVKPEYFDVVKKDLFSFIIKICNTLPCPICTQHASEYMRSINFNNIRTKEDLIQMFHVFHNVVNARKNYEFFKPEQLAIYETANTVVVIRNFMVAFEDKTRAFKLMADDMARTQIASQLKFWLNANLKYFDP